MPICCDGAGLQDLCPSYGAVWFHSMGSSQQNLVYQLDGSKTSCSFVKSDSNKKHSVTDMLYNLQWQTVSERRAHSKAITMYGIFTALSAVHCHIIWPSYLLSTWFTYKSSVSCYLGAVLAQVEQPGTALFPASIFLTRSYFTYTLSSWVLFTGFVSTCSPTFVPSYPPHSKIRFYQTDF